MADFNLEKLAREIVIAVCRGLMSGMILLGKDLPGTAVAILGRINAVAVSTHQDPAEFMGAGNAFESACETAGSLA